MNLIKIKQLEDGKIPKKTYENDVCFDCYSRINTVIEKNDRTLVPLGFALQLPDLYEAVIRPRSGLSKKGVDVAIGTIDSNYRGEVIACVINNSKGSFEIQKHDRICQLAIREIPDIKFEIVNELEDSERGEKGFGSSGL